MDVVHFPPLHQLIDPANLLDIDNWHPKRGMTNLVPRGSHIF